MKDLGVAKKILGMRITRDKKNRTLNFPQSEYIKKVLKIFNMQDAKVVSTPLASHFKLTKEMCPKAQGEVDKMSNILYISLVFGSLMYVMVYTWPDIAHAVGVSSRYMRNLVMEHWNVVKWILLYLKGTTTKKLCFTGSSSSLSGFVDCNLARDIDTRRSTIGYFFTIGSTAVKYWISRLQKVIALSTTKAEYVATMEASKEMISLQ